MGGNGNLGLGSRCVICGEQHLKGNLLTCSS